MPKRVNELKKKRAASSAQAVKGLSAAGRGARTPAKRDLPQPGSLTVVQILRDMLASHSVNVVEAVNNILEWMPASGIRCTRFPDKWVVDSRGVRQELTALPRSLSMLRSICARSARDSAGNDRRRSGVWIAPQPDRGRCIHGSARRGHAVGAWNLALASDCTLVPAAQHKI